MANCCQEILARYAYLEGKHDELVRELEEERSNRSARPSNNEEMYRSYMHRMTEMLVSSPDHVDLHSYKHADSLVTES